MTTRNPQQDEGNGYRPSILIVEDEPLIALDLAATLGKAGFNPVGVATTISQALRLLASASCEAVVLDILLGNTASSPIAAEAKRRGIPFICVTGWRHLDISQQYAGCAAVLDKPIDTELLIATLRKLVAEARCLREPARSKSVLSTTAKGATAPSGEGTVA